MTIMGGLRRVLSPVQQRAAEGDVMAGTTAFVWVLLGVCVVAVTAVIARAKVEIAKIQAKGSGQDRAGRS